MGETQIKEIEEMVRALGKVLVCTQCYYYKVPNWAKNLENVVEQCTLGLEPREGGECMLFKPKKR